MDDLPRRLRAAIERAGLTHQAVADHVGVQRSAVSQWVRVSEGDAVSPTVDNLSKAVTACGLTMEQFFALKLDEAA